MLDVRRIQHDEGSVYREIRLRALRDAPDAFTTTYAQAIERNAGSWDETADGAANGTARAIFFILTDGKPTGLAALYLHPELPGTGELLQVWVAPEHRGSGAADALLDALFRWGTEEAGFSRVIAEVKASNTRALGFYRRYGFDHLVNIEASDPDEIVLEWIPTVES
ncbi:MAG: GNAT family N-acetyltransferase [Candidatus Hydrogenedentes bacterium]|nr:GNAT family N-acetyltransferase [Candidatus Hydrogenedentota bacterium]